MEELQIELIEDLYSIMKTNKIFKCLNIELNKHNNEMLIVDKGKYSLWIRKGSILGYYPGLTHTFFTYSSGDISIDDQNSFDYVVNQVAKCLQQLRTENIKTVSTTKKIKKMNMKHLKTQKQIKESLESSKHLLIVHHESGDEIHFNVIDYSLYPQIDKIINDGIETQEHVNDMLNIIYNNKLEHLICQTYVLEDYTKIGKYNIVKCIHLPELGC